MMSATWIVSYIVHDVTYLSILIDFMHWQMPNYYSITTDTIWSQGNLSDTIWNERNMSDTIWNEINMSSSLNVERTS